MNKMIKKYTSGFTLIEMLVVMAIIGILVSIVTVAIGGVPKKARDVNRKSVISGFGRALAQGCYLPSAGAGTYDLADIFVEWKADNPEYAKYIVTLPYDPHVGSETETNYKYKVTADNHCVVYANLENSAESVNLTDIDEPSVNSGVGILEANVDGWNGTKKYYQYSR